MRSETGTLGTGWDYIRIGASPSYTEYFSGIIDDVFIMDEALTKDQLDVLMNASHPVVPIYLYAGFTGNGTYKYNGTTWTKINTVTASSMMESTSDLYATFTGYAGLYKYYGTAWSKLTSLVATVMESFD